MGKWKNVDITWFAAHLVFSFFFLTLSWFVITQIAVGEKIPGTDNGGRMEKTHVD
jgi:hypothetical protein